MVNASLACTAVDIVAADKSVIAGRTMEWAFDMQWTLVSLPKGTPLAHVGAAERSTCLSHECRRNMRWSASAPRVIPGGALLEGQNSAGLGMSGNFLPGFTQYQTVTPQDKSYVSILAFGAWALGHLASVAEVRAALPTIKVWTDPSLPTGPTPPTLHFVFTDRSGASIVVEYVNGELQHLRQRRARADQRADLRLAPAQPAQLSESLDRRCLQRPDRRQPTSPRSARAAASSASPATTRRPSRFVRAAFLRHNVPQPGPTRRGDPAHRPHPEHRRHPARHRAKPQDGSQLVSDYTQWVAIKDLTNNRLMIADYNHR